jgi:hypothetical protein
MGPKASVKSTLGLSEARDKALTRCAENGTRCDVGGARSNVQSPSHSLRSCSGPRRSETGHCEIGSGELARVRRGHEARAPLADRDNCLAALMIAPVSSTLLSLLCSNVRACSNPTAMSSRSPARNARPKDPMTSRMAASSPWTCCSLDLQSRKLAGFNVGVRAKDALFDCE